MGGTQRQAMYTLALLTIVALTTVTGRPAEDLQNLENAATVVKEKRNGPPAAQSDLKTAVADAKQPTVDEAVLLAVLPTSLPAETPELAELKPEDVKEPVTSSDPVDVPVVIADLPLPETMVIVSDDSRGRFLRRLPRAYLPAEARDTDGSDGNSVKTFSTYYNSDATTDDSGYIVLEEMKDIGSSFSSSPKKSSTKSPLQSSTKTPTRSHTQSPTFFPARLEDHVIFPGFDEEDLAAKKMRKHRVLFRSDEMITAPKADTGGSFESAESTDESKKVNREKGSPSKTHHTQAPQTYEVTKAGQETTNSKAHKLIYSHRYDNNLDLQLIHHYQQDAMQIIKEHPHYPDFPSQLESIGEKRSVPFGENRPTDIDDRSPSRRFVTLNPSDVPIRNIYQRSVAVFPSVFNTPAVYNSAYNDDHSVKSTGSITGYFPFMINDGKVSLHNTRYTQSNIDTSGYERAPPRTRLEHEHKHKTHTQSVRRARAINAPPESSTPKEETTTGVPDATTILPESREVGNRAGPIVQTITQYDDEIDDKDKVQTTIVLHGVSEPEVDDNEEDDDEDDEVSQSPTALDESDEEIEESGPTNKGDFQKKLKDKLDKIQQKIRKRIKTSQQNVNGLRRQVNRHVTDVMMLNEGGLQQSGPFVSKLVVRKGGVAIAGPGGIATAGFGGTAIVGPGGTAYTSPDSLAVAGPGARVISVPSAKLQEMFDSFRKGSGRNIEAFKPSWLGTIPPDGKLVATGPVVFFNPPEQVVPGFTIALEPQEKADVHQDRVLAEAPADLSRTSSEGFPPYIEPFSGGVIQTVLPESLGGRPAYIPIIDSGRLEMVAEGQKKVPPTTSPVPTTSPASTTVTPPSVKVREEMIAGVKEQIKAEISGAVQNQPLKLMDIVAPVEDVKIDVSDQERAVEEALKPYQDLLSRVQESSAVDLVVGDVGGRGEATTRLLLRPMAKAVAGRGGIAVAAPLSRAVVRGEQPVRVRYQPNIVAVAGPSGMAHALGELLLQYGDRP